MATKKSGSTSAAKKSAAPTDISAAKLKALQKRLNADSRLRQQFLKNPGPVLRRAGIELGAAKEQQLGKYTREVTAGPGDVFGAEIARVSSGRIRRRIRIMTRIGVSLAV